MERNCTVTNSLRHLILLSSIMITHSYIYITSRVIIKFQFYMHCQYSLLIRHVLSNVLSWTACLKIIQSMSLLILQSPPAPLCLIARTWSRPRHQQWTSCLPHCPAMKTSCLVAVVVTHHMVVWIYSGERILILVTLALQGKHNILECEKLEM